MIEVRQFTFLRDCLDGQNGTILITFSILLSKLALEI